MCATISRAAPAFYLWKAIPPVGVSPAYELSEGSLVVYVTANGIICAGVATVGKRRPTLVPAWLSSLALALPMFRSDFPARQILADRSTLKAE